MYPLNATGIEQTETHYKFDKENTLFNIHNNVDKALKLQILEIMEDIYTCALKEKYVAYGNLISLKVITHIKSNYYKIIPVSLNDNVTHRTSVYNVNQSFETIINQIEVAVDFSNARKVPYTPE